MGEELRVRLNSAPVVLHLSDIHKNYAEDYQWQREKRRPQSQDIRVIV